MLEWLSACLEGPALEWFNDQPEFISLHEFDIALTNAFPPKQINSSSLSISAPKSTCETSESSAVSALTAPPAPPASQEQQEQQEPNALKIAKKTKANAVKNAKRAKSKALKAQEAAKPTPTLQDIGIFDPTLTCEDRQFSESAEFLQHLQQCQHLYRESDLLMLLPTCLWGSAFDIWFDKQTIMKSASLSDWIETLRVDFANAPFAKSKINCSKIICMRCDSSFNSKDKLREHVREQHAKKPVKSSFLPVDTPKLVSETMEKSAMTDFPAPPVSQEPDTSTATSKHKSESVMTSGTVNSSKDSHLTSNAPEIVSESMENESNQCSSAQMFSFSRTLEIKHQDICVQEPPGFCSSLTSLTPNLVCEAPEKSAFASPPPALLATPRKQILEPSENRAQEPPIIGLSLSIDTAKSVCESEENSAVTTFKRSCPICRIDVSSVKDHFLESPSCNEALRHRLNQLLARRAHQREQEAQKQAELAEQEALKQAEVEKAISPPVSPVCLNLPIATPKSVSESLESASNQEATCARVTCKLCKQNFNSNKELYEHIRNHEDLKPVKKSHLSINAVNLVCEVEETSLAPHKLPAPSAKPQKPISESAIASRTVTLLKRSNLPSPTPETKSESTEKPTTYQHYKRLSSEQKAEWRSRTAELFTRLEASRLDLPLNTFVTIPETVENASIQEVACARALCRPCKQNFNSNKELYEHIRNHEALKRINTAKATCKFVEISTSSKSITSLKSSPLTSSTLKPLCGFEEKSTSTHPPPSHESLIPTTSRNLISGTETPLQPVSPKRSSLQLRVPNSAPKPMESASIQRAVCARTTCKRCNQIFNSNNKLHEHIRQHHARKPVKSSDLRVPALESTFKVIEKPAAFCPPAPLTPQSAPPTPPATPRSQISSAEMPSRPVSPKGSHLSIATLKITPKPVEKLPANCQLTPPPSPSRTPVRKHQDCHMQKSYLTMDDLSRMFTEKPRPFGLRPHQDRPYSPQSPDIRQSSQPCSSTASKKPYLTIENLSEMFGEKSRRKGMFQGQKNVSSRGFSSGQSRITAYFKPTANQKVPISQISKSSKPKRLDQHMPAESIRTASSKGLPEKSANLPYKLPDVSCVRNRPLQILDSSESKPSKPRTPAETPSFILVLLRLLPAFLLALAFVSAISATKMGCINAYGQAVSAIDRAIR